MRRYPSSTLHRYLDLPSTQRIQTHNSHRHNTNPPLQTLVQPPTPPTPPQPKHRHTSNTPPALTGLVNPKPNPCIYSLPSPPKPPRAKHIHISHTSTTPLIPRTTLIHNMSAALYTISESREPPTCPALTTTTPHPSHTLVLPSTSRTIRLSQHTHMQHKQQYTHHIHSNHLIHIGYHNNLTDRPKTTT